VVENEKAVNTTVSNDFSNFSDAIENFFPTLAGVTAQTHYQSGQLTGMNITINTQFYGLTEIESFTQYVATTAAKRSAKWGKNRDSDPIHWRDPSLCRP
jgi:protein involved in sex pheromone biosynthesis